MSLSCLYKLPGVYLQPSEGSTDSGCIYRRPSVFTSSWMGLKTAECISTASTDSGMYLRATERLYKQPGGSTGSRVYLQGTERFLQVARWVYRQPSVYLQRLQIAGCIYRRPSD